MIFRFLTLSILLVAGASGQTTDITGWSDLRWGTAKAVALKTVQALGAHESAAADVLVIEKYSFAKVPFTVRLLFTSKNGLSKAFMAAEDRRDAFDRVLSELTARYGRPGLQSEYDGDDDAGEVAGFGGALPHMLEHGFPANRDKGFAGKSGRRVPGWNHAKNAERHNRI